MSIFSSSVKSQIIDPVFHSNTRCEFRLANRGESYMPTMRIGNLGLSTSGFDNTYHFGPGAMSVISRIQLLDGNEPIDTLRNVGNWLTFKNSLKSNSQNDNVFNNLVGGSLGWATGATGELLSNDNKVIRQSGGAETLGTLDLREVFPYLNSVSHLSTKLFKNLRVVIEYNTAYIALANGQSDTDTLTKTVPILIVDEIIDEALAASLDKQFQSATWTAIEHDQVGVPAVPGIPVAPAVGDVALSKSQSVSLRVNGFQNKAVGRVMVSKVYQDLQNYIYGAAPGGVKALGQYGSKALHKEEFNMRINGRNVLAGRGTDSPASMAMLCADTWGELNTLPGSITESLGLDTKYDLTDATLLPATLIGRPPRNWVGAPRTYPRILTAGGNLDAAGTAWTAGEEPTAQQGIWIGNSAWIGMGVHDRVSDMQIQLTRVGNATSVRTPAVPGTDQPTASAGNEKALDLHVFAEVQKSIQISNGSYKISYA